MQRLIKITNDRMPTIERYIVGQTYKGKGVYLGVTKGVHKFERHTKPFFQKATFGPKYFFEKA